MDTTTEFHDEYLLSDGINECLTDDLMGWSIDDGITVTVVRIRRNQDGTIEFVDRGGIWSEDQDGFLQTAD